MDDYLAQGIEHLQAERYDEAVQALTNALRLTLGDIAQTLYYRGIAYGYLGDYEQALDDFNRALAQNPNFADAYNERGNAQRFLGYVRESLQDYGYALLLDDAHTQAYYNRALAYEALGMLNEAERDLTAALKNNPTLAQAYELRGTLRAQLNDLDGAIADLERYLRMGGGREFDNHSETQALLITLRLRRLWRRILRRRA